MNNKLIVSNFSLFFYFGMRRVFSNRKDPPKHEMTFCATSHIALNGCVFKFCMSTCKPYLLFYSPA